MKTKHYLTIQVEWDKSGDTTTYDIPFMSSEDAAKVYNKLIDYTTKELLSYVSTFSYQYGDDRVFMRDEHGSEPCWAMVLPKMKVVETNTIQVPLTSP